MLTLYQTDTMKTLVPPQITPGPWLKADGSPFVYALTQNGWNKGQPQMVNRFSASIQRGFESSDAELEANATMLHAAPAMAEALARLLPDFEIDESAHDGLAACEISVGDVKAIRAALLAAGYTEAADQE